MTKILTKLTNKININNKTNKAENLLILLTN